MGEVVHLNRHVFAVARTVNEALTRAAKGGAPENDFERGAMALLFAIADASGLGNDPRALTLIDLVSPRNGRTPTPRKRERRV